MSRKPLTHEEFMEKFYVKNENAENIEILEKYKGSKVKIKCKCKIDGYEWEATPDNLLHNRGCPICGNKTISNKLSKSYNDFINKIKEINSNIEILGEYVNRNTKIKCKCKIDGYEWEVTPHNLLNDRGCPKCSDKVRKNTEYFINELKEINDNIEILGEYVNAHTKIKCKCKIDGYEWETTPHNLLNGKGCPKCSESKGEKRVAKYLDSRNINYIPQYKFDNCKSKKELPFDFYIPSLNIAIEYDGEDHYMIFKRNKNENYEKAMDRFIGRKVKDTIKTIYCKENNIKLIRIPYWDFDNIEKILEKEL